MDMSLETNEAQPPPADQEQPPAKKRNKSAPRTSRACIHCRKQKMRCEGATDPPCKRCRHQNLECIFERRADYLLNPEDSQWQARINARLDIITTTVDQIIGFLSNQCPLPPYVGPQTAGLAAAPSPLQSLSPYQLPAFSSTPTSSNGGRSLFTFEADRLPLPEGSQLSTQVPAMSRAMSSGFVRTDDSNETGPSSQSTSLAGYPTSTPLSDSFLARGPNSDLRNASQQASQSTPPHASRSVHFPGTQDSSSEISIPQQLTELLQSGGFTSGGETLNNAVDPSLDPSLGKKKQ